MPACERRRCVLEAAMTEFARGGYAGTATEAIAERAGISQPYLFRLFGTKLDLFLATVSLLYERIEQSFRHAADGLDGPEALAAMADAYHDLLEERDLLMVELHSFAAASDPQVQQATRQGFRRLWDVVGELTGLPNDVIRPFFAQGMLLNVVAALDAYDLTEGWAKACQLDPKEFLEVLGRA
jgi:AcrR family transcriptional regulator